MTGWLLVWGLYLLFPGILLPALFLTSGVSSESDDWKGYAKFFIIASFALLGIMFIDFLIRIL